MSRAKSFVTIGFCSALSLPCAAAPPFTYNQLVERLRANNPTLRADFLAIEEFRASEITAGLRPNPQYSFTNDQYHLFRRNPYRPFNEAEVVQSLSQLIERRNKRPLRLESARGATGIATAAHSDLERNLLFVLRTAFVAALQAESLLDLARDNLAYYDKVIDLNRDRYQAGDLAKIDFERVELQRVQYESDLQNATVNLRTAKIQLLAIIDDPMPVDGFDLTGDYDAHDSILSPDELRRRALASRPDLRVAELAIAKSRADNRLAWANGSTDPTVGIVHSLNGSPGGAGFSVSIPLRIFDRNQGEKERTALDIARNRQLRQATLAAIYRDVDSANATLSGVRELVGSYKRKYLAQSTEVRDIVAFSFSHGGASLIEFLDAQKSYRDTQLAYRNLIAAYLNAAAQLNLAVGEEVIP